MPDKIEKYLIDKELIDSGWADMQAILDREMPVTEKQRRILPFWWWSGGFAIAAMLLAGLFVLRESNNNAANMAKNTTVPKPESISTQSSSLSEKTASEAANTIIPSTKNDTPIDKINTPTKTSIATKKEAKKQVKIKQNSPKSAILVNGNVTNNELVVAEKKSHQTNEIVAQKADNELFKKEDTSPKLDRVVVEMPENLAQNSKKLNPLAAEMFPPTFVKMAIKTPKQKAFQHALFARFNYVGLIDNGYSYGYLLRKNLKGRHSLQARLFAERNTRFVHTISETYTIPKELLLQSSLSPTISNTDTTFSQIVYPFNENCACAAIARANNYSAISTAEDKNTYVLLNSTHIGLGLNYAYRLNPRWELSAGFGFSRAIKEIQYTVAVSNASIELPDNIKTSNQEPINTTPNPNYFKNYNTLQYDTEQIFNRLDGYWEFGANFHVTKRFVIGGGYRRGIIDITKNDALGKKDFNKFGIMQGIFYF